MGNYIKPIKKALKSKTFKISLLVLSPLALIAYLGRNSFHSNSANENNPDENVNQQNISSKENIVNVDSMDFIDEENEAEEKYFGKCRAISTKGTQCRRKAVDESGYCWQHKKTLVEAE